MISVSLPQFIESLLGTQTSGNSPAAQSGDFSSLLAGAPTNPAQGSTEAAARLSLAIATSSIATSTRTVSETDDMTQPSALAPAAASPLEMPIPDEQSLAELPAGTATSQQSDPSLQPRLDGRTTLWSPLPVRPPASSADARSKADDQQEDKDPNSDPAALTIQQVLAAAALLAGPGSAPQPTQLPQQAPSGKVLAEDSPATLLVTKNAPSIGRAAGSLPQAETGTAQDSKSSGGSGPMLTPLQSHSLGLMLDQQGPGLTQIHAADRPSAPLGASHASGPSALPQSHDLHQLDALVRDIAELSGTTGRAAMRLTAEQLGPLEIRLHRSDAGMTVSIRTESEQSHSTVAQAQQQLSDDMRANGLKVAATSVMLGHGGADAERHDRQPLRFAAPIEAAAAQDGDQPQTQEEQRPAGRYA